MSTVAESASIGLLANRRHRYSTDPRPDSDAAKQARGAAMVPPSPISAHGRFQMTGAGVAMTVITGRFSFARRANARLVTERCSTS